jgi:two-component system chemotaxis sensor kinase CheA
MSNANKDDQSFILEALPVFIAEANEQLTNLEDLLLQLEEDPENRSLLDELFRCVHTIKGSAGIFGLSQVVAFTHHVETLLDQMREGEVILNPALNTLLLQCGDAIQHLIDTASNPELDLPEHDQERRVLVNQLQTHTGGVDAAPLPVVADTGSSEVKPQAWNVAVAFGSETFRNGMDPLSILSYLESIGSVTDVQCHAIKVPELTALDPESCFISFECMVHTNAGFKKIDSAFSFVRDECELSITTESAPLSPLPTANPDNPSQAVSQPVTAPASAGVAVKTATSTGPIEASSPTEPTGKSSKTRAPATQSEESRFIRVQADRLDAVINLLGELVVASAGAEMQARQSRQNSLIEANLNMARLIEEIRNGTLQLRMVPIGEAFSRFRRVVRDTANALGKDVNFELFGGETELDKSMVEKISDPMMHLVRNALDHGLENPEERLAAGKPSQGVLRLSAKHETGSILIQLEDDGRGIRRQKVLERAWERGLVERGVTPSDAEILKLIFAPGFSTADQVTNLSGRGVGMDVVRSNIESLRGSVQINSTEGKGTQINIRLPLTLAIIDGFLVSVGESKFILPLESVVEVIETTSPLLNTRNASQNCVELRGKILPVINLRRMYNISDPLPKRTSTIVVHSGMQYYGIAVDNLMGQHQTVIKPMGRIFKSLQCISGSSILGNGEVALILDIYALGEMAEQQARVFTQQASLIREPART